MAAGMANPSCERRRAAAALRMRRGANPEPELYLAMEHRRRLSTRP